MFIYKLHFNEVGYGMYEDLFEYDICFQANGIINLYEMGEKIKKIVDRMNDEEDELYEEYSDYDWESKIDYAFDMVVENEYHDVEKIDVFTATIEI